jgi:hypothetical protein
MRKITTKIGGVYLDHTFKVMDRTELNKAINEIQDDNIKMLTQLDEVKVIMQRLITDTEDYSNVMNYLMKYHPPIRK